MRMLTKIQVFSVAVLVMILVFSSRTNAKQIFYNSLDSQKSVEDGGGEVHAGSFVEGAMGKGFYSKAAGEAVSFPTEGKLLLETGTLMQKLEYCSFTATLMTRWSLTTPTLLLATTITQFQLLLAQVLIATSSLTEKASLATDLATMSIATL